MNQGEIVPCDIKQQAKGEKLSSIHPTLNCETELTHQIQAASDKNHFICDTEYNLDHFLEKTEK